MWVALQWQYAMKRYFLALGKFDLTMTHIPNHERDAFIKIGTTTGMVLVQVSDFWGHDWESAPYLDLLVDKAGRRNSFSCGLRVIHGVWCCVFLSLVQEQTEHPIYAGFGAVEVGYAA